MALFCCSWLLDLVVVLVSLLLCLRLYYWRQFQYWKKLNIPYTEPSFPFGNLAGVNVSRSTPQAFEDIYNGSRGLPFIGMWSFFQPTLLVRDPELIKGIFIKDFMSFHDRGVYVNEKEDPLAANLFSIGGTKWRNLRSKMSPTFTSGKMKMMFPIMIRCSETMKKVLNELTREDNVVEVREIAARYTTDIISLSAFGINSNSLENPGTLFREMGKKIFEPTFINSLRSFLPFLSPKLAELFKMRTIDKEIAQYFMDVFKETIDYRETSKVKGNDFMQLVIQLMKIGEVEDDEKTVTEETTRKEKIRKLTFEEAAAQAFLFFVAGFETSSTTIQFALYELALNPEIQERTRAEIQSVLSKHNNQVTYEAVFEMEYLGRVIDETLRKYPPVGVLIRESNRGYIIPDTDITLPRGATIQIPILGIHHDPEYFPNPERFDPERFTDEEKAKRHHFAYLPFGEGPRNCIGLRFGLLQVKVGVISLLSNFKLGVCEETPIPLRLDPKSFIATPTHGVKLRLTPVENTQL